MKMKQQRKADVGVLYLDDNTTESQIDEAVRERAS